MGFFDDNFYKDLDKNIDVSENNENDTFISNEDENSNYQDSLDLEVNKRNKDTFDDLMDNASFKTDDYWDFNNPIVKVFLFILLIIIVGGLLYYIISWFNFTK